MTRPRKRPRTVRFGLNQLVRYIGTTDPRRDLVHGEGYYVVNPDLLGSGQHFLCLARYPAAPLHPGGRLVYSTHSVVAANAITEWDDA